MSDLFNRLATQVVGPTRLRVRASTQSRYTQNVSDLPDGLHENIGIANDVGMRVRSDAVQSDIESRQAIPRGQLDDPVQMHATVPVPTPVSSDSTFEPPSPIVAQAQVADVPQSPARNHPVDPDQSSRVEQPHIDAQASTHATQTPHVARKTLSPESAGVELTQNTAQKQRAPINEGSLAPIAPRPLLPATASVSASTNAHLSKSTTTRSEAPSEVHVHIGRIEVTALPEVTPTKQQRRTKPGRQPMSLDEYLGKRGSERR